MSSRTLGESGNQIPEGTEDPDRLALAVVGFGPPAAMSWVRARLALRPASSPHLLLDVGRAGAPAPTARRGAGVVRR